MAISTAGAGATIQATDIRLGRMLQEYGLINDHQLFDALQTQAANGGRLASILVRRGCLSDMELAEVATSRKDTDVSTHNVHLTLAPVPVDCVSLPGAVAMCLSLIVPEGVEWGSGPSASCFATMNLILPDRGQRLGGIGAWPPCAGSFRAAVGRSGRLGLRPRRPSGRMRRCLSVGRRWRVSHPHRSQEWQPRAGAGSGRGVREPRLFEAGPAGPVCGVHRPVGEQPGIGLPSLALPIRP